MNTVTELDTIPVVVANNLPEGPKTKNYAVHWTSASGVKIVIECYDERDATIVAESLEAHACGYEVHGS